jgi:hypothetical protein
MPATRYTFSQETGQISVNHDGTWVTLEGHLTAVAAAEDKGRSEERERLTGDEAVEAAADEIGMSCHVYSGRSVSEVARASILAAFDSGREAN